MKQFFYKTAENEVVLHSWRISVVFLGIRALELQEKYYGKTKQDSCSVRFKKRTSDGERSKIRPSKVMEGKLG
jgi:hypothetical protein